LGSSLKRVIILLFFVMTLASPAVSRAAGQNSFKVRAMAALGYDDNPRLDSARKGDTFAQEFVAIDWKQRFGHRLRLRSAYDVLNLNYFEITDQSALYQSLNPGFDVLLSPAAALQFDYRFEYLYFQKNEALTSFTHSLRAGILQKLNETVRVRAGVTPSTRQFTSNKIHEADGAENPDDDRTDARWASDAEVIVDVWKDATLRTGFIYTRNDSDDTFNDFYDHDSYAFRVSLGTKLSERVFGYARVGYEKLVYDSRPVTSAPDETEDSDVYTASVSLLYALDKNTSLGLGYSYRQKESNDSSQTYSGSTSNLGLYHSF